MPELEMENHAEMITLVAFILVVQPLVFGVAAAAWKTSCLSMAALDQYLAPDENAESRWVRSAAYLFCRAGRSHVFRRTGYAIAAKGANGFVCIGERD